MTAVENQINETNNYCHAGTLTVGLLIDLYVDTKTMRLRQSIGRSRSHDLGRFRRKYGNTPISELGSRWFMSFVLERVGEGAARSTVAGDLSLFKTIIQQAIDLHDLDLEIALAGLFRATRGAKTQRLVGKSRVRNRIPTNDEISAIKNFLQAKNRRSDLLDVMPDIIDFSIATGMRISEVCRIRWDDLDELNRIIMIRGRKHPDPEEKEMRDEWVPLLDLTGIDALAVILRQSSRPGDGRVFPFNPCSVTSAWQRANRALGIRDNRYHDLRRLACTRLFKSGMRLEEVAIVSGHRDWRMLKRYLKLSAEDVSRKYNPNLT
jgi:integrase